MLGRWCEEHICDVRNDCGDTWFFKELLALTAFETAPDPRV